MICPQCHGSGQIMRPMRTHYRWNVEDGGAVLEVGPVVDACPACTAEAEAEWQALTLLPLQRRFAAE